jgi:predicted regulator of Ras-like GTPase activity (Roadblock/LC7/MglB family)
MVNPDRAKPKDTYDHIDHEEELLGGYLSRLQKVKGYMASAIMTFRGELLASHSSDSLIDLQVVAKTFNDIFRTAHEASEKIGLEACLEIVISTPRGSIIMHSPGVDALIHFHLLAIISSDGSLALAKMELDRMTAPILAELS